MFYRLSADLVLIVHLAFILFVVLGGFLVLRRPRLMWLHLPAVVWGALSEFFGILCPLTTLETMLHKLGGESGYEGDFIAHHITAVIYLSGLTRGMQIALGFGTILLNMAIYGYWLLRKRQSRSRHYA
jgi:hypothetical protein